MADSDQSLTVLRYNQITQNLEAFGGGSPMWTDLILANVSTGGVPSTRLINTTAPLMGGGNLSADRTLSIPLATGSVDGYLSHVDWTTFNSAVPGSNGTVTYTASTGTPVTPSATRLSVYSVTVDANLTIDGPTGGYDGQKVLFQLHNDASHVVTFATGAANFNFTPAVPSYTATPNVTDYVGAVFNSGTGKWDIVASSQSSGSGGITNPAVLGSTSNGTHITGTTYTATQSTASFTLSNSAHRVKVTVMGSIEQDTAAVSSLLTIFRDNTTDLGAGSPLSLTQGITNVGITFIDSPGDTASHSYTVYAKNSSAGSLTYPDGPQATILLEEIF